MSRLRPYLWSALFGALLLLSVFALESVLLLRAGAIGLKLETAGPFAALMNAVRPLLPNLLGRIAALYAIAGALIFAAAHAAVVFTRIEKRKALWTGAGGSFVLTLVTWHAAVERPTLFDDLPFPRGLWAWLAERGSLSTPLGVGGLAALVLIVTGVARRGVRVLKPVVVAAAASACVLLLVRWHPAPGRRRPLVVLIGVDAFRPDRLTVNGAKRAIAPNLDALVADSVLFDRAYTPIGQTEPAWRSLLTARWPRHTGVRYSLTAASRSQLLPTFVDAFARAGWMTSFRTDCSRFHYEDASSGFAVREQPPRGAVNFALEKLRYRGVGLFGANELGAAWLPEMVDNRALAGIHHPFAYADRLADSLVDEARGGPLLFTFHATSAHFPGDPTYPYYRTFTDPASPLERRLRMVFSPVTRGAAPPEGATKQGSEALYDALIAQADAQVGQLVTALKDEGLYDDATIVLFSDHGESFYADQPELQGATSVHGARLGDEEYRVLLAVKTPGSKPARVDSVVRLIDVGPTLLELSGLSAMTATDGRSFAAALRGEPLDSRIAYAETGYTHASPEVFDPLHAATAPRTFDAFRVREDGIVEVSPEAHEGILAEKDRGVVDAHGWLIRKPQRDGTVKEDCVGTCSTELRAFLDAEAP